MSLLVDTSVWSLALRRDRPASAPEVEELVRALSSGESVITTGLILQELLQGFAGPRSRDQILERLSALPFLAPARQDHVNAAELRNSCRRAGVQIGTIDALLAQLCLTHSLTLLTTDRDFDHVSRVTGLKIWRSAMHVGGVQEPSPGRASARA
jgi:predicted nucleic acid-binding protein